MNRLLIDLAAESDMQFKLATVPADILEEFANAIIRECIATSDDVMEDLKAEGMDSILSVNTLMTMAQVACKNAICEKFGVKP